MEKHIQTNCQKTMTQITQQQRTSSGGKKKVEGFDSPRQSTNLNPIEHAFYVLKRRHERMKEFKLKVFDSINPTLKRELPCRLKSAKRAFLLS